MEFLRCEGARVLQKTIFLLIVPDARGATVTEAEPHSAGVVVQERPDQGAEVVQRAAGEKAH